MNKESWIKAKYVMSVNAKSKKGYGYGYSGCRHMLIHNSTKGLIAKDGDCP